MIYLTSMMISVAKKRFLSSSVCQAKPSHTHVVLGYVILLKQRDCPASGAGQAAERSLILQEDIGVTNGNEREKYGRKIGVSYLRTIRTTYLVRSASYRNWQLFSSPRSAVRWCCSCLSHRDEHHVRSYVCIRYKEKLNRDNIGRNTYVRIKRISISRLCFFRVQAPKNCTSYVHKSMHVVKCIARLDRMSNLITSGWNPAQYRI